jgi:hypothetical protein
LIYDLRWPIYELKKQENEMLLPAVLDPRVLTNKLKFYHPPNRNLILHSFYGPGNSSKIFRLAGLRILGFGF